MLQANDKSGNSIEAEFANEDEIYTCPSCGEPMRVRCKYGAKVPHYYGHHNDNCKTSLYDKSISNVPDAQIVKHSLEEILNRRARENNANNNGAEPQERTGGTEKRKCHVSTPRTLLTWLSERRLTSLYIGNVTVDDIILDNRNAKEKFKFKKRDDFFSIAGTRMCVGKTIRYDCAHNWICFGIPEPEIPKYFIHIVCEFESCAVFKNFVERIKKKRGETKFKNRSIAAFGEIAPMEPYINPDDQRKNCRHILLYKMIIHNKIQVII
jgi:predicted RNA-binding Zn-ribbon protein involved in translation (DUF1610 family)